MVDFLTEAERSERMGRIRFISQLEVAVREYLEEQGYDVESHSAEIISHPDIVIRGKNAIVFVHGCFWHRHQNCRLAASVDTSTKKDWDKSFARQVRRDQYVLNELLNAGWRVLIAWECAVSEQKAPKDLRKKSLQEMVNWLESDEKFAEIRRPAD